MTLKKVIGISGMNNNHNAIIKICDWYSLMTDMWYVSYKRIFVNKKCKGLNVEES